jgi:tRNA(Met) C34 N-acetyltransferase TmcA
MGRARGLLRAVGKGGFGCSDSLTARNRRQAIEVRRQGRRASVRFLAPQDLVKVVGRVDLVVVDEAAAIPTPLIKAMLLIAPLTVLSSTVDG